MHLTSESLLLMVTVVRCTVRSKIQLASALDGSRNGLQRVNLGLELVAAPALLLLDEPTSGLDSTASRLVMAAMQRVKKHGCWTLIIFHGRSVSS